MALLFSSMVCEVLLMSFFPSQTDKQGLFGFLNKVNGGQM